MINERKSYFVAFILITGFIYLALPGCSGNYQKRTGSVGSEPLPESQIIDLSVESECMEREMPVRVYLPKGYGGGKKYPVWYGLHGHSSDETMWTDVGITQIADGLFDSNEIQPMIMVFPSKQKVLNVTICVAQFYVFSTNSDLIFKNRIDDPIPTEINKGHNEHIYMMYKMFSKKKYTGKMFFPCARFYSVIKVQFRIKR